MLSLELTGFLLLIYILSKVIILYHGKVKNRQLSHDPLLRPSIEPWLKVLVRYYGFNLFLFELILRKMPPLFYFAIIKLLLC